MFLELSNLWIVTLNVVGIPIVHLSVSYWVTKMPASNFRSHSALYKTRDWENGGRFYETVFRVKSWKDKLPDAGPWFSGFSKGSLKSRSPEYLAEFREETCRGEFAHWVQLILICLFVAWNPFPASLVIVAYSILSNLPCLISQRHTRSRLNRVLSR